MVYKYFKPFYWSNNYKTAGIDVSASAGCDLVRTVSPVHVFWSSAISVAVVDRAKERGGAGFQKW